MLLQYNSMLMLYYSVLVLCNSMLVLYYSVLMQYKPM